MKNNLYLRSTFRDIRGSLGRFIAIILIIFMAVLLFVGIKSVGPDLESTIQSYVTKHKVSDLQVVGTAGLTEDDLALAEKVTGAKAELGYSFAYADEDQDLNLQVYSYDSKSKQNTLNVVSGKLPTGKKEIVLDATLKKEYPLNSQLTLKNDQLAESDFTVVGYVESPIYVDKEEKGATNVGDGTIDGFAYLNQDAFDSDAYSIMYVSFTDLQSLKFSSDAYEQKLIKKENQLEDLFAKRKTERKQELTATANQEISKNEQELADNQAKLTDGQKQLDQGRAELAQQKDQLKQQKTQLVQALGQSAADAQLAGAEAELAKADQTLADQQAELTKNQQKINDGQKEIADAKQEIADLKTPNYLLTERSSNPGFEEVTSLSTRIDAIGNVFPVFFFLIGILITFTTITRMVEEDRKVIGTLKALGYRNREIAQKYLIYALLTALIGTVLGVIVGTKFLPPVVFNMLSDSYVFKNYPADFWFTPILIAVAGALLATLGATIYILIKDLREKPMALLQPKAPKPGKRIFLEYITPLWRRLSFNQKVTYRNLFRYKARMILTVAGIAGCCGLMVAGFGLRDSIGGAAEVQFNQLNHFQGIVTLEDDFKTADAKKAQAVLTENGSVKAELPVYSAQMKFKQEGVSDQSATVYAFEQPEKVKDYFTLKKTTSDSQTSLSDQGGIITSGLAKAYDVSVGDDLSMQNADGQKMKLKVSGIVENYLGNNVFLSQSYLAKISGEKLEANSFLIQTKKMNQQAENKLAKDLQVTKEVITTTFMSDQVDKQAYASANFQPVVLIFIVLSGTLALVVLFNLTNINVSERERELATIKVLGFFDPEVTMYIVRESIIFTIMGILLGFGVGNVLTWFIINTASSPMINFPLLVPMSGYLFSAGLTIAFSVIVMLITHQRLKGIDMIGALKSNE